MTISTVYRDGTAVAIDLDTTIRFLHPDPPTVRIVPPPRRPKVDPERFEKRARIPRTIGVVDSPLLTGELPALVEYCLRPERPSYAGRHRLGLFARLFRLFGRGRRDGV